MELKGRTALVTGANRGIGRAIAMAFAREGANVLVHFHSDHVAANDVVTAISKAEGVGLAVQADVRARDDVARMIERGNAEFGPIEILVNNARQLGAKKKFLDLSWSDYETQLDVILKGTFNCCQAVLPPMMKRKSGRIINILSTAIAEPDWRWHVYGAAKSALLQLSRNLAAEMGEFGITVNMVSPGFVPTERQTLHAQSYRREFTDRTPMGRLGRPEETADTVAFLASDRAAFITGANIPVCGGKVMF